MEKQTDHGWMGGWQWCTGAFTFFYFLIFISLFLFSGIRMLEILLEVDRERDLAWIVVARIF